MLPGLGRRTARSAVQAPVHRRRGSTFAINYLRPHACNKGTSRARADDRFDGGRHYDKGEKNFPIPRVAAVWLKAKIEHLANYAPMIGRFKPNRLSSSNRRFQPRSAVTLRPD